MSMLSGFTSKLRERAKVLMQGHWSNRQDRLEDALMMEDAANTIDRLRCMNNDLSRLRKENDKLRELAQMLSTCMGTQYCVPTCPYHYIDDKGYWCCKMEDLQEELGIDLKK